jgi:hypothetical protein
VSTATLRRGLPELGGGWKRATRAAKGDDPQRVEQWARMRFRFESLPAKAALCLADEREIPLSPTVGYPWRPTGEQGEGLPPGPKEQRDLAGALARRTGTSVPRVWGRKAHGSFLALLRALESA